jgi:hypothetical protein
MVELGGSRPFPRAPRRTVPSHRPASDHSLPSPWPARESLFGAFWYPALSWLIVQIGEQWYRVGRDEGWSKVTRTMDDHSYIFGDQNAPELSETKEVKMRLPISHLIRLHGLKLLTGQNISDTVTKALEEYFQQAEAEKRASSGQ